MYFAVVKLTFESGPAGPRDRKELHSLAEKLRSRFKVCAAACSNEEDDGSSSLALTALGSSEEKLSGILDAIGEFCESSGFGRVASETALMDDIEALQDYETEDEEEDQA